MRVKNMMMIHFVARARGRAREHVVAVDDTVGTRRRRRCVDEPRATNDDDDDDDDDEKNAVGRAHRRG